MNLVFDKLLDCGAGHSPQCIHDPRGALRIVYLDSGLVKCRETTPSLGSYDSLTYEEKGRISPDESVSLPSLKKVAHFGAYGFWNSALDHKFVVYMKPTDISEAFVSGSTSFSATTEVASLSAEFINIHGELLNRYRALVTPGTKLELFFSIGDSGETPLGVFYIDRASISYPDGKLSVSGRNAVGKLLKEQTFDEMTIVDEGSLHDNLVEILEYAGVEHFFVGDTGSGKALTFEPETTLQEGINYAITNAGNWKLGETLDGVVGVAPKNDARFDPTTVHSYLRDHSCWSYSIEFDDSDAASRICVYSKGVNEEDPTVRAYVNVTFNKWWAQPTHRTTHVETVKGATQAQVNAMAAALAEAMAASGRIESFVGIFTPQLVIGDEVHIQESSGATEVIGAVTDIKHNFGKDGFYTSFSADSGGRRGRATLKDLIDTVSKAPQEFTGTQNQTADGDEVAY